MHFGCYEHNITEFRVYIVWDLIKEISLNPACLYISELTAGKEKQLDLWLAGVVPENYIVDFSDMGSRNRNGIVNLDRGQTQRRRILPIDTWLQGR